MWAGILWGSHVHVNHGARCRCRVAQLVLAAGDDLPGLVSMYVSIGALDTVIVRFLCGGVDFAELLSSSDDTAADVGGDGGPPAVSAVAGGKAEVSQSDSPTSRQLKPDGRDGRRSDGGACDGKSDSQCESVPIEGGDGDVVGDDDGDGDGDGDDDEDEDGGGLGDWKRRTEHRYISSVVLDKLSQQDDAVTVLCQTRVLAYITGVIRENRIQREAGEWLEVGWRSVS